MNEKATVAVEKPSADKRDASTATEDLGANIKTFSFICSSWFILTIFLTSTVFI